MCSYCQVTDAVKVYVLRNVHAHLGMAGQGQCIAVRRPQCWVSALLRRHADSEHQSIVDLHVMVVQFKHYHHATPHEQVPPRKISVKKFPRFVQKITRDVNHAATGATCRRLPHHWMVLGVSGLRTRHAT